MTGSLRAALRDDMLRPMLTVYIYQKCSTCRDAIKWLDAHGVRYVAKPIRETPPSRDELAAALERMDGRIRRLFNTSGMDYRAQGLAQRLPGMSDEEAIALLCGNGMLVKRPFVIGDGVALAGFDAEKWRAALL